MSTAGKVLRKAIVATTSPLFEQLLKRLAIDLLSIEIVSSALDARALATEAELLFIQEELAGDGELEALIAAARTSLGEAIPIIVFGRDPNARSQALARGAFDYLSVPCRSEEFRALAHDWIAKKSARPTSLHKPPVHILLVDDSTIIHTFVRQALQTTGYILSDAHDGLEGFAAARRILPDLVISDIDMPNLDGYEMCRRLRADSATQSVPILILSGRSRGVDVERGFSVGANAFLSKPVAQRELLSRIDQLLARSGRNQSRRQNFEDVRFDIKRSRRPVDRTLSYRSAREVDR